MPRPRNRDDARATCAREIMGLSVLPLLATAEHRITDEELDQLEALCASLPDGPSPKQTLEFRLEFWSRVARASRNVVLEQRVSHWVQVMSQRTPPRQHVCSVPVRAIYTELTRVLRRRTGTVQHWLSVIEPLFEASEARLGLVARYRPPFSSDTS